MGGAELGLTSSAWRQQDVSVIDLGLRAKITDRDVVEGGLTLATATVVVDGGHFWQEAEPEAVSAALVELFAGSTELIAVDRRRAAAT